MTHPEGPVENVAYHLIAKAETGSLLGMTEADDSFSNMVGLHLWAIDLPASEEPHGQFAMTPDNADQLADMLREAARAAREER